MHHATHDGFAALWWHAKERCLYCASGMICTFPRGFTNHTFWRLQWKPPEAAQAQSYEDVELKST